MNSPTTPVQRGIRVGIVAIVDRAYRSDGTLVPRSEPGAVIHDLDTLVARTVQMVTEGVVEAVDGTRIPVEADTVLLHGDNADAVATRERSGRRSEGGRRHRPGDRGPRGQGSEGVRVVSGVTCIRPHREFVLSDCGDSAVRLTSPSRMPRSAGEVGPHGRQPRSTHAATRSRSPASSRRTTRLLVEFDCATTTHDAIRAHVYGSLATPRDCRGRAARGSSRSPSSTGENSARTSTTWQNTSSCHPPR